MLSEKELKEILKHARQRKHSNDKRIQRIMNGIEELVEEIISYGYPSELYKREDDDRCKYCYQNNDAKEYYYGK